MHRFLSLLKLPLIPLFLVCIFLPLINSTFKIWKFERTNENRNFKDSVSVNYKQLDKYPGEYEEYLKDNFSFRSPLLNYYHKFKLQTLKISPHPDQTIIGQDNWYFLAGSEKEIYEGKRMFSNEELEKFYIEWKMRKDYFDVKGIKFYWVICPFKHYVYANKLPFTIRRGDQRRVDQLKNYLESKLPNFILDPLQDFVSAKDSIKLYQQMDNHMNLKAGQLISKLLLDKIRSDMPQKYFPSIPDYKWKDSVYRGGIHYNVLGNKDLFEIEYYPIIDGEKSKKVEKYGFPPTEGFAYKDAYETRFLNMIDTSGLKLLVIDDSFGERLMPFIKESFKESLFIFDAWQYRLNKEIIEKYNPDIVVYLSLETHIDHLILETW